jgi:hypothetical protein
MSSHKSGSVIASENVDKRPHKSTTLEEMTEVIRRMEGEQSCPTLCRDLNMVPSTVTTMLGHSSCQ